MAVIVQDDNGTVTGANSYLSVAAFKAYHDERLNSYQDDDEKIEGALIKATDYVDGRFKYKGRKLLARDQRLQWPRTNCYDSDRNYVNGIPQEVKDAVAEYALRAMTGDLNPDPDNSSVGEKVTMKKEVIGPIEETTQFSETLATRLPRYPAADLILRRAGLVISSGEVRRG